MERKLPRRLNWAPPGSAVQNSCARGRFLSNRSITEQADEQLRPRSEGGIYNRSDIKGIPVRVLVRCAQSIAIDKELEGQDRLALLGCLAQIPDYRFGKNRLCQLQP